jgi:hypothetical protein
LSDIILYLSVAGIDTGVIDKKCAIPGFTEQAGTMVVFYSDEVA